ncbi:MAG: DUF6798 domain-containing protein, partial [Anaerolineales bacterium]
RLASASELRDSSTMPARLRSIVSYLAWGILFGLAYAQSPLYTSNQNQYFLHGLARAGVGHLSEDWLAGTADPTPVFSGLVALTARFLHPNLFYLYFLLLAAVYYHSLRRIAARLFNLEPPSIAGGVFAALLFAAHSAALRFALGRGVGGIWEYAFDGGVAGQRLLGDVLQPSAFGAFLLVSIQQQLEGRSRRALVAAALAATIHPTYLLSAAVLTAAYAVDALRQKHRLSVALQTGGLALLLVLPILIYVGRNFLPASAEAQRILVTFRLPAHAIVEDWFDRAAIAKLAWIGLALYLARATRLAGLMAVTLGIGVGLTLLQVGLNSDALALAFPWRVSTILVPLATAVVAGAAAGWIATRVRGRGMQMLAGLAIGLSVVSGAAASGLQEIQRRGAPERAVLEFVKTATAPVQVYLIPPRLQDFRLVTGAPIVADFKSIPYRGDELLDWYERNRLLGFFYRDQLSEIDCGLLDEFTNAYGATHVVLEPDQRGLDCPGLQPIYEDGQYSVYRLDRQG